MLIGRFFGLGCALPASTTSRTTILRFTGLGLARVMPNAVTLMSEYRPTAP